MISFSHRIKLEKDFLEWAKENGVSNVPNSVIAFLQINNLLNEDAVIEYCKKNETVMKSVTPSGIDWKEWEEFWA